jgi:hypothetical protein
MWFQELTGFKEESPEQVRANLEVAGNTMTSRVNGRSVICGRLETPSLAELRSLTRSGPTYSGDLKVSEVTGDVKLLHADTANAGALFQVASQFNLLEMISPQVGPEQGVGRYDQDLTQGPACAVAAGAGTIYRTYFAEVNGQTGQSSGNQIDCLQDFGTALGNDEERLWRMQNGYALPSVAGLEEVSLRIKAMSEDDRDRLREKLKIGIQWDTQVTIGDCKHLVTQAYCSALPVAYSKLPKDSWKEFAQLVLEASYEATLCAAVLNFARTGNNRVYLTLLGGGVFGNDMSWIVSAARRALEMHSGTGLDVAFVSYRGSKTLLANQTTR